MDESPTILKMESILDRMRKGDDAARDEMINVACHRLTNLSRKMFRDFPRLRQWEQTEDVSQNAAVRLRRALESITPGSPREFFGLASVQIRRVLLDMTRSVYGRKRSSGEGEDENAGPARPQMRVGGVKSSQPDSDTVSGVDAADQTHDPGKLSAWSEFHEQVEELPDDLREVVDMLFYQELTQQEAADAVGVNVRTIKRRWRDARIKLHEAVKDWLPGV